MSGGSLKNRALILLGLLSTLMMFGCWGMAYRIPTDAMKPNITREDMCVTNPLAYQTDEIRRFDIVVFEMPESEKKRINVTHEVRQIKRIIGLPGETIELRDNKVFINNEYLTEPFEKIISAADKKANFGPVVIPQNEYFLLGDNRPESMDSRYFEHSTIKRKDIYSQVVDIKKGFYSDK